MNWNKITIPSAGTWKSFSIGGRSITIESMPLYYKVQQVPVLAFNDKSNPGHRIYPQSDYNAPGKFGKIWIQGTTESAGDEIYIISYNCHKPSDINPNLVTGEQSIPGTTVQATASDAVQSFADPFLTNADGDLPKALVIEARNNPFAFAFNADPDQAGFGMVQIHPDITGGSERAVDPLVIEGLDYIRAFRYINANNTAVSQLIVTPRY